MKLIIDIPDSSYETTIRLNRLCRLNDNDIFKMIKNGIPLTESDDCVSREAVIETLKDVFDEYEVFLIGVCGQLPIKCVKAIYSLPSVQPKRDKGEWIKKDKEMHKYFCNKCSCGEDLKTNFCSNCGADMRGEQNGS